MNHIQLYFIITDWDNNIFDHYHDGTIGNFNFGGNSFLFTLNSNEPAYYRKVTYSDRYYSCQNTDSYCGIRQS